MVSAPASPTEGNDEFRFSTDNILLVEIPVKHPWKIFRYISVRVQDEYFEQENHVAVAKYWYERYGAVVACISRNAVGYILPHPVAEDVMNVAEEHFAYCPDCIYKGYENFHTLASSIKKSTVWHFRWD